MAGEWARAKLEEQWTIDEYMECSVERRGRRMKEGEWRMKKMGKLAKDGMAAILDLDCDHLSLGMDWIKACGSTHLAPNSVP